MSSSGAPESRYIADEYGFWFQRLMRVGRARALMTRSYPRWHRSHAECCCLAIAFALVPWLLGWMLSAIFGELALFLRTPAFYLGVLGTAFVMWAMTIGIERLCGNLCQLEAATVGTEQYRREVSATMTRGADRTSTVAVISVLTIGLVTLIVKVISGWDEVRASQPQNAIDFFPDDWRADDARVLAGIISTIFALWVAAALGTASELLLRNILFVRRLRCVEFVAFPAIVRMRLHPFVQTYLFASLSWSLGVALCVVFFVGQYSTATIIGLALLFVIGVLTFAVPYVSLRLILDRSHEQMSAGLARRFVREGWQPDFAVIDPAEFTSLNTAIAADAPPVLSRRGALAYVAVQVVVVVSLVEKAFVQGLLNVGG